MTNHRHALVIGTGQVGTFAAARLAEAAFEVRCCDSNPSPGYHARFGPPRSHGRAVNRLRSIEVNGGSDLPDSLTLYEVREGVAVLTLNNPRRRNALSFAMMSPISGPVNT